MPCPCPEYILEDTETPETELEEEPTEEEYETEPTLYYAIIPTQDPDLDSEEEELNDEELETFENQSEQEDCECSEEEEYLEEEESPEDDEIVWISAEDLEILQNKSNCNCN